MKLAGRFAMGLAPPLHEVEHRTHVDVGDPLAAGLDGELLVDAVVRRRCPHRVALDELVAVAEHVLAWVPKG